MRLFFLQSTVTAGGHLLKWMLTLITPSRHNVHGRHGHGSPVKNCWRFSKFRKKYETLTHTSKICILQEKGFKEFTLVLFESFVQGLHILFYIFGQTIYWSTAKPWTSPKKRSNDPDLGPPKDESFVNKFKVSFVCIPEDVWTSNFGKCLKMPQR
jgi:hypothetical protein